MALLDNLMWRYATKKYDSTKIVSEENVDKIVEATRLTPTSSGLQQFRVVVIKNKEIQNKIVPISYDQQIVADCSHLLVFVAWDSYTEKRIDDIYDFTTDVRDLPRGRFTSYTDRLKQVFSAQTEEEHFIHTSKQAYIGLGLAIAQAAELTIDCTPMEGFENDKLDELLNLKEQGLRSVLMLPLGYRDTDGDWLSSMKKVRIAKEDFVTKIYK